MEAKRAEEYLRDIHAIMERSVKHSTLSGMSGIVAGLAAIAGAVISKLIYLRTEMVPGKGMYISEADQMFLVTWLGVFAVAVIADIVFTKRKAAKIGKRFFDRPMRRVLIVFLPGLVCGMAVTEYAYVTNLVRELPAFWMLFYGLALISASTISLQELWYLGAGFIVAGVLTMFPLAGSPLLMMGMSFGGFHLAYGVVMWKRYGG